MSKTTLIWLCPCGRYSEAKRKPPKCRKCGRRVWSKAILLPLSAAAGGGAIALTKGATP